MTDFFAGDEIEKLARETGFVKRSSEIITAESFLNSLLFTSSDQKELSLNDLSGQLKGKYKIDVSKQGVDQRFSENSVKFMKAIMEKLIKKIISQEPVIDYLGSFNNVLIKDSTSFQLPESMADKYQGSGGSGSEASVRIQFEFDIKTGRIFDLSLHAYNNSDQTNASETKENISKGDLLIRDLGYISIKVLTYILLKGAFFLNRINSALAYEEKNDGFEKIDFVKIKAYLEKKHLVSLEKEVYLGEKKELKVRMVVELLPEAIVKDRLTKANKIAKKKGYQLTEEHKARLALNIYITNIGSKQLPIAQVRSLYRLRWQIELVFKVWKSVVNIEKVKKMKVARFETVLYAKLIRIVMNWSIMWEISKIFWATKALFISPIKFFKTLQDRIYSNWVAFKQGKKAVCAFITDLYEMSEQNHVLEQRNEHLSSLEIQLSLCASYQKE